MEEQLVVAYAVFPACVVQLSRSHGGHCTVRVRSKKQLDLEEGEALLSLGQLREHLGSRQRLDLCVVSPVGVEALPCAVWEGSANKEAFARLFTKLKDAFHYFWSNQQAPLDRIMRQALSQGNEEGRETRCQVVLEYSRSEILQAGDFGHMSFHSRGDASENQALLDEAY
jgi:hypothetical protein